MSSCNGKDSEGPALLLPAQNRKYIQGEDDHCLGSFKIQLKSIAENLAGA